MPITNCHTHIFTNQAVPDGFLPLGLMRLVRRRDPSRFVAFLLRSLQPFDDNDRFNRAAAFARMGSRASQAEIFERLQGAHAEAGEPDARIVVLPMDMDFMTNRLPPEPYRTQLDGLSALRQAQPEVVIPFFAADPRRPDLEALAREFLENGFGGIKIYPPLGYYPFDERLDPVYELALEFDVPVLTHCSRGGVHYCEQLRGSDFVPPLPKEKLSRRKNGQWTDGFAAPSNYWRVVERFPDLRLCLAHCGGESEWDLHLKGKPSWVDDIVELMRQASSVYTDISYTAHEADRFEAIAKLIDDPEIGDRVLYGSDFYMVQTRAGEADYLRTTRDALGGERWRRIATENPERFLGR